MNGHGKSDSPVVPAKPPNNTVSAVAEAVEGRGLAKGNTDRPTRPGRSAGTDVPSGLDRVREAARRDKDARFTALLHHVDLIRLGKAYEAIRPQAAPGVDGTTWRAYGEDLEANLRDLHRRLHSGAYRASPSRRAYIPKADGRLRPLGIATLEDKIVQRAVVEVLNAVYEVDFLGFSYGFRPGRSPHDALDALAAGIYRKKVNWVLDADIRDFFTSLDHGWLEKFLRHRIADERVLRLIRKWLRAGVIEDGNWSETETGAPQGGSASPLLANVYLHYVFDRWARQWRRRHAHGDMIIVRFADDCVPRTQGEDRDVEDRDSPSGAVPEMEVGPPGSPCRGRSQTTASCVGSMAGVVSVAEKAFREDVRCEPRRRAKANHSMTGRKRSGDIETGVESLSRDELGGSLLTARAVSGLKVARARFRLWCGTWEPAPRYRSARGCRAGESETPKQQKLRGAE